MGKLKRDMNVTLKECPSITKAHAAYITVKSFFYLHIISEHDKQNILNFELALFHLICRLQVSYRFLKEKVICIHVLV